MRCSYGVKDPGKQRCSNVELPGLGDNWIWKKGGKGLVAYGMTSGFLLFHWMPLPENRVYLRRKWSGFEEEA